MKVLQIIPSLELGGAETMCAGLSRLLKKQGQEVTVVSLYRSETPIAQGLRQAGIPVVFLDKKPGLDLRCIPRLRRLIRKEKPDVLHIHLYVLKYVAAAAIGMRIPMIHTIHSVASYDAEKDTAINVRLYRSGRVTPVSLNPQIRQTVMDYYGLPEDASPVIFNGIDLDGCIPKTDYSLHQPPRIIHMGRFAQPKNHPCMVRAVKLLADRGVPVKVSFFGAGDLLEPTQALARELGVEHLLEFRGVTNNVYPHLHEGDLFILPSVFEGMPMTIIEAMGTGLPIIAANVGGIPDMLSSEHSGILIPPEPEALADAILRLLENQPLRQQLGLNARAEVTRFSGETMARKYIALYSSRCS